MVEEGQSLDRAVPQGVSVSLSDGQKTKTLLLRDALGVLTKLLACKDTHLVGHNIAFDTGVILKEFPLLHSIFFLAMDEGRIHDTMLREKILNNASFGVPSRLGLADLTKKYWSHDLAKGEDTWRLRYGELLDVPISQWPTEALQYAEDDVIWTLKVFREQEHQAVRRHGSDVFAYEPLAVKANYSLRCVSIRGCAVDSEQVSKVEQEARDRVNETLPLLLRAGLIKAVVDPKDAKLGAKVYVTYKRDDEFARSYIAQEYEKRRLKPQRTESGLVSIDGFSCSQVKTKTLQLFAQYNVYSDVLHKDCTFLKDALRNGGRCHTTFDILKMTGRVSSRNPNLQNIRREGGIRECFVPDPGKAFVFADYGSAELHTLAQVCLDWFGESVIADKLREGVDLHIYFAAAIAGQDYSQLYAKYNRGVKKAKEYRQMAKAANYGLGGFMGPATFSYTCAQQGIDLAPYGQSVLSQMSNSEKEQEIYRAKRRLEFMIGKGLPVTADPTDTRETADDTILHLYNYSLAEYGAHCLRDKWLNTFPEMKLYKKRAQEAANKGKLVLPGIPLIRTIKGLSAAANTPFQGLAAQGALSSLWEIEKARHSKHVLRFFEPQFFIHDEIGGQAPAEKAEDVCQAVVEAMCEGFNKFVPDVPVKVEGKVSERWIK